TTSPSERAPSGDLRSLALLPGLRRALLAVRGLLRLLLIDPRASDESSAHRPARAEPRRGRRAYPGVPAAVAEEPERGGSPLRAWRCLLQPRPDRGGDRVAGEGVQPDAGEPAHPHPACRRVARGS